MIRHRVQIPHPMQLFAVQHKTLVVYPSNPPMARNFNATRQDSPARSHLTRRGVLRMTAGGGIASLAVPSLSGPATAQEGGEEHWRFETDERIRSSPTIVDGTVFLGSDDGNLYALSEDTGDEQWRFTTNGYVTGAPAVVDGLAFIGSWDNTLYAVETDTGEEVWRVDTDGNVSSAPTVVNQTVFVNAQEYLFAFDAATGEEQWYDEISASGTTTCSAVTEHDLVFAGVEHGVGGRSADAGELRAYTLEEGTREISNELGTGITTAPTVDDGLVFAGAQLGANSFGFYAIDAESGTEEWEFEIEDGFSASPTVAEGTVYVGSGGGKL